MSTIADLGNGLGYLYITEADGSTFIYNNISNNTNGKLFILNDGTIGAPVSGEIRGTGTLTLTGTPDDLTALTVNAVPIIGATVPAALSLSLMADAIRDAINTYVSAPDYYAQSSGATVYIFTSAGVGANANGFAVAAACDPLMTVTATPIAGGTNPTGIYDASTGHRYFINATGSAPVGSLTGATEITKYILTRGTQTSQYSTTATIAAGVIGPERILKEMDLTVDTQGGAGADDLDTILTAGYNDFDEIIIRGANPAHIVTVKNATGNIYLANNLDWSSGNNQNVLALKKIGNSWYEEFRSPNLELTVANMRASGFATPVQGVDVVTMPTNGTVNIEPGVDKGYYVVSGSPALIGSVVYQIQPSPSTPYLDGDSVTVDYIATATPGVNNVTIFGITLTPTQANLGNVVVTTTYDLSSTTWYSTLVTKSDGRDLVDSTQLATKEDSLGNPAIDGYFLSSTASGVRSWVAPAGEMQSTSVSISASQILNLYTNPIELVPAPGAGFYIDVVTATLNYQFVTTPYATNTSIVLYEKSTGERIYWFDQFLANLANIIQSSNSYSVWNDSKSNGLFAENLPLKIFVHNGNPTAGDGTLIVNVLYRILPV
jgi:hypothetical protein